MKRVPGYIIIAQYSGHQHHSKTLFCNNTLFDVPPRLTTSLLENLTRQPRPLTGCLGRGRTTSFRCSIVSEQINENDWSARFTWKHVRNVSCSDLEVGPTWAERILASCRSGCESNHVNRQNPGWRGPSKEIVSVSQTSKKTDRIR